LCVTVSSNTRAASSSRDFGSEEGAREGDGGRGGSGSLVLIAFVALVDRSAEGLFVRESMEARPPPLSRWALWWGQREGPGDEEGRVEEEEERMMSQMRDTREGKREQNRESARERERERESEREREEKEMFTRHQDALA